MNDTVVFVVVGSDVHVNMFNVQVAIMQQLFKIVRELCARADMTSTENAQTK